MAVAGVLFLAWAAGVLKSFLMVQLPITFLASTAGAWLFYIQHQYEDTYYMTAGDWDFERAALQGSSYLALPPALAWVVGNANYHHVHHLSARIPNYNLRAAHEQQPLFAQTPVVTFRSSLAALRLKLWDERHACLVPFTATPASGSA